MRSALRVRPWFFRARLSLEQQSNTDISSFLAYRNYAQWDGSLTSLLSREYRGYVRHLGSNTFYPSEFLIKPSTQIRTSALTTDIRPLWRHLRINIQFTCKFEDLFIVTFMHPNQIAKRGPYECTSRNRDLYNTQDLKNQHWGSRGTAQLYYIAVWGNLITRYQAYPTRENSSKIA